MKKEPLKNEKLNQAYEELGSEIISKKVQIEEIKNANQAAIDKLEAEIEFLETQCKAFENYE